jgi:hypothetical protein
VGHQELRQDVRSDGSFSWKRPCVSMVQPFWLCESASLAEHPTTRCVEAVAAILNGWIAHRPRAGWSAVNVAPVLGIAPVTRTRQHMIGSSSAPCGHRMPHIECLVRCAAQARKVLVPHGRPVSLSAAA